MAILSNINGLFAVEDNGAIKFNNLTGTNNQVLIANTNSSPTWVDVSTIIGGPYLPLTGGALAGAGNLVIGGTLAVNGVTTFNADATFAGIVTTDKIFVAKGQNLAHVASSIIISQESTTKSQIRCYGADAATAGTFELILSASDGAPSYTALAFGNTANATFAGTVDINGSGNNSIAGDLYFGVNADIFKSSGTLGINADNSTFSGNVGIGGTPGQNLDIQKSGARFRLIDGTNQLNMGLWDGTNYRFEGDANRPIYMTSYQGNINFGISGGTTMTIQNGKVGIATTAPQVKLDIARSATKTNTGTSEVMYIGTSNEASNYATLQVYTVGATAAADRKWMFQTIEQGVANAGNISFQPSGGNVGIGTTAPDSLLVVQADAHNEAFAGKRSATEFLWFLRNESNSGRFQLMNSSNNTTIEMTGANGRINQAQMIAGTAFALSNGGFATLGSTSSSVPIAIAIDGDASTASIVVPTNKNVCIGGVYNYAGTGVTSLNINGTDYPLIAFYSGSTLRTQIISYSNNTYFGHPHASAKWSYENGTGMMGELSGAGNFTVKGDVVAYGSPSDISLKENIKPIKNPLGKIKKLKGVTFDWKKSKSILDIKEDYGFIAQDVKKVIPELVRKNKNELLSMRHQGIIPILVEAVKELEARVKELENK